MNGFRCGVTGPADGIAVCGVVMELIGRPWAGCGTMMERSSGLSVYRLSVAGVSNTHSMAGPVLSNMDVATSSCEGVCSYSFVLFQVLEEDLKSHM